MMIAVRRVPMQQKKSGGLCSKLRINIRILSVLFLRQGTL